MTTIADRLREAMKQGDGREAISQNALSHISGVPQATISRILSGGGPSGPETTTLTKLARARGINFLWLQQGIGPKYSGVVSDDTSVGAHFTQAARPDESLKEALRLMELFQRADRRGRTEILRNAERLSRRVEVDDAAGSDGK